MRHISTLEKKVVDEELSPLMKENYITKCQGMSFMN